MYRIYKYTAIDPEGKARKGILFALNKALAAKYLLRFSLSPVKLAACSLFWSKLILTLLRIVNFKKKKRFKIYFVRQLADYLAQNFTLQEALISTIENTRFLELKLQLHQVLQDLSSGMLLTSGLRRHTRLFTASELNLLGSAEKNDNLGQALIGLHDNLTHTVKQENMLIWFLPALVFILATALVCNYLANNIVILYAYNLWLLNIPMPRLAQLFQFIYKGNLVINILQVIILLVLLFYFIKQVLKLNYFIKLREWLLCHMPLVKSSVRLRSVIEFTQAMALGLKAKLPLHQVIYNAANALTIQAYKQQMLAIHQRVVAGYDFSVEIKHTNLLKSDDVFVFQSALKTNKLAQSVATLNDYAANRYRNYYKVRNQIIKQVIITLIILLVLFGIATMLQLEVLSLA